MKMETPKMDVVRFDEADVIVASGFATRTGRVQNVGGAAGDLIVTVSDDHTYTYAALADAEKDHMQDLGSVEFVRNNVSKTIADLFANDTAYGDYDGYYESYDDGYSYIWKRQ